MTSRKAHELNEQDKQYPWAGETGPAVKLALYVFIFLQKFVNENPGPYAVPGFFVTIEFFHAAWVAAQAARSTSDIRSARGCCVQTNLVLHYIYD